MNCIETTDPLNKDGYGFSKGILSHRWAYCMAADVSLSSIAGLVVMHTCDNPACVNPHHLVLGTQAENMRDMCDKGRQAKGERHGSAKLTAVQVREIILSYRARSPEFGGRALAAKYGVSNRTISDIINGKKWV